MATINVREKRVNNSGAYDTVHRETSAGLVLTDDGRNVGDAIAAVSAQLAAVDKSGTQLVFGSFSLAANANININLGALPRAVFLTQTAGGANAAAVGFPPDGVYRMVLGGNSGTAGLVSEIRFDEGGFQVRNPATYAAFTGVVNYVAFTVPLFTGSVLDIMNEVAGTSFGTLGDICADSAAMTAVFDSIAVVVAVTKSTDAVNSILSSSVAYGRLNAAPSASVEAFFTAAIPLSRLSSYTAALTAFRTNAVVCDCILASDTAVAAIYGNATARGIFFSTSNAKRKNFSGVSGLLNVSGRAYILTVSSVSTPCAAPSVQVTGTPISDITLWREQLQMPKMNRWRHTYFLKTDFLDPQTQGYDDHIFIHPISDGITIKLRYLMGFENFAMAFLEEPEEMTAFITHIADNYYKKRIKVIVDESVCDAILLKDMMLDTSGIVYGKRVWDEFLKPAYASIVAYAKSLGVDVFFHEDGKYEPYFVEDLIAMGVDMIMGVHPGANNDMDTILEQAEGRILISGGLDWLTAGKEAFMLCCVKSSQRNDWT